MSRHYVVVEFTNEKVQDIITSEWMRGRTNCVFPSMNPEGKMINHAGPSEENDLKAGCTWEICPIRIIAKRGK